MKSAFWKQVLAGLMLCGLVAGCGSEQDQLQDEKQDVQDAQQELQEEKEDVRQEKMDDPAAGESESSTDTPTGSEGLEPTPDDPDSSSVREEEADAVPKEAGGSDG